jgi:signal transduction histidine kinase
MQISLASKISLGILGVLLLAVLSSVVAIFSAYRFESLQKTVVQDNLSSVRAAEELEVALLEQRGYVSSYILDGGNSQWLKELDLRRRAFDVWLGKARASARSDKEREILDRLEVVEKKYAEKRDSVVTLYNAGEEEQAKRVLLHEVVNLYERSYAVCEEFIEVNTELVEANSTDVRRQVEWVRLVVTVSFVTTLLLGLALLWVFFRGVIFPLRALAADARVAAGENMPGGPSTRRDELRELGHQVQLLMSNVAETRSDLKQSQTQLAHAEKLAAVGKLAASVAHEIRNPLTAVKMWLFSLRRDLDSRDDLRKKVEVVSEEIGRLEKIVSSFLEFSRPPQLKLERLNVDEMLDKILELQKYRFEQQEIKVLRENSGHLPEVTADAEQLRQVFVNLINNAVEAMTPGGRLRVATGTTRRGGREMLVATLADTGSGMPQDVQERVFEPFFTTKPEGTGLGMCVAASIMARHGGALKLESSDQRGTTWTVWIPLAKEA